MMATSIVPQLHRVLTAMEAMFTHPSRSWMYVSTHLIPTNGSGSNRCNRYSQVIPAIVLDDCIYKAITPPAVRSPALTSLPSFAECEHCKKCQRHDQETSADVQIQFHLFLEQLDEHP